MKANMNFQNDLREIAEGMLDNFGLQHSSADTTEDKLNRWLNTHFKLIYPTPRELVFSKKILQAPLQNEYQIGYESIKNKLLNGLPVNCHLSKSVFYEDKPDYLFFDWGIYHLHLSTEPDPKNNMFCARTNQLLFLYITKEKAYFIDIRPHDEDYVFAQKELLEIIYEEWQELLEPFRMKGFSIEQNITSAEDIHKLRAAGALIIHKVGNNIYMPMGGGASTAKNSLNITTETDRITIMARNAEKWIEENIIELENRVKSIKPIIDSLDFKLVLNEKGFFIVEQNSKTAYKLEY